MLSSGMLSSGGLSLPDLCAELSDATIRLDGPASTTVFRSIAERLDDATPADATEGITRFVPALEQVALGNGGLLAQLTAGMIEAGADPRPVLDVLVERVTDGLERAARFGVVADELGDRLAEPTSRAEADALSDRVRRAAPKAGLTVEDAAMIVQAWFTIHNWIPGLLLPLQQKRARQVLPQRDRLTAAAAAVGDRVEDATWLLGLLLVLDDEPLIVVHRATGRVYPVTISGIGDNFQLHTLLAATLIGDLAAGLIPGTRPDPSWIAAATDGEMAPSDRIRGQFNLVDATGAWIWNEGRPADIPRVADRRVVVLDPPPYQRSWNIGRAYPLMLPELRLDPPLPAADAAEWVRRVAPAGTSGD